MKCGVMSAHGLRLGINNKKNLPVIHLSLPKSVEQYYQEAGRAGGRTPRRLLFVRAKRDTGFTPFLSAKSRIR